MNKHYLKSQYKSTGMAYLLWFFLGVHYGYLGKWGLQILYWVTLAGLGIWWIVDLFTIPDKVNSYNLKISKKITEIEKKEKEEEYHKNMTLLSQIKTK
ncbi:MAG TPA: TM2 domain-containing protein [Moheibacter sp.]|nr:TM2 domain-containing protein [Moheibacter sp.]